MKELDSYEKLRLVLIFTLKYGVNDELKANLFNPESERIVEAISKLPRFEEKENALLSSFSKSIGQIFREAPNVFTQHKSLMRKVIESAQQNKLDEVQYPYAEFSTKEKVKSVVVVLLGGATYQEAREAAELKATLLTSITINSKVFIADIINLSNTKI
jgi:hypothetical protein